MGHNGRGVVEIGDRENLELGRNGEGYGGRERENGVFDTENGEK